MDRFPDQRCLQLHKDFSTRPSASLEMTYLASRILDAFCENESLRHRPARRDIKFGER